MEKATVKKGRPANVVNKSNVEEVLSVIKNWQAKNSIWPKFTDEAKNSNIVDQELAEICQLDCFLSGESVMIFTNTNLYDAKSSDDCIAFIAQFFETNFTADAKKRLWSNIRQKRYAKGKTKNNNSKSKTSILVDKRVQWFISSHAETEEMSQNDFIKALLEEKYNCKID